MLSALAVVVVLAGALALRAILRAAPAASSGAFEQAAAERPPSRPPPAALARAERLVGDAARGETAALRDELASIRDRLGCARGPRDDRWPPLHSVDELDGLLAELERL